MRRFLTFVVVIVLVTACARGRQYELRGQVVAVDRSRQEITIKHEDVKGFMPAMTMPFKVRDAKLLEGRAAGDLVSATLVVEDAEAYLVAIAKTGSAPVAEPPPARPADILGPGDSAPDVELIDQAGRHRTLSEWRGRVLVVTFVYTRCPLPDFCPRMDRNFVEAQRGIVADARLATRVHLLSVSFDPGYDTPEVLAGHARRVGAKPETWTYATGERDAIERFAGRFGVSVIRSDQDLKEIVHNLRTAVISEDGTVVTIFNGNEWTADQLLTAVRDAATAR